MQAILFKVTGMTCGGCVNSLTRALKSIAGVGKVDVLLATGETSIEYDEHLTSAEQLEVAIKKAGYGIEVGA